MTRDYVTCRLDFVRLRQDVESLAECLTVAGRELRRTGALDMSVEDRLSQLLHEWDTLEHHLSQGDPADGERATVDASTLNRMQEQLDVHQQLERAKSVLRSVQEIQQTDGRESAELRNVHRDMHLLEETLSDASSGPSVSRLVEGTHAANALLSLILDGDKLSDKEWSSLQSRVQETYGAAIAAAAVRGRLTIDGSRPVTGAERCDEPSVADETVVEHTAGEQAVAAVAPLDQPSEPVQTPESLVDEPGQPLPVVDASVSAEPDPPASLEQSASLDVTPADGPADDVTTEESIFDQPDAADETKGPALIKDRSVEWEELSAAVSVDSADASSTGAEASLARHQGVVGFPKRYHHDHGLLQVAAEAARSGSALNRDRHVSHVILHLAEAGRLGLAAHVARGQEVRGHVAVPFLPSWLLEAMVFAPHVTFVRGRLAALLEGTLSHCDEREWHELSDEWREGMGFFVRAATLRPSVVSPGTRAATILRSFALNSDCSELYNFCARIATSGERLQGLMPALFTQRQAHLSKEDHVRVLQAEVQQWCELLADRTIHYAPAKQLFLHAHWSVKAGSAVRQSLHTRRWQKWQQTLRLAEGVVRPVRDDDSDALFEVKAEIRRLSANLREGSWADSDGDGEGDGMIRLPHPSMRNVLREAMAYGQRWVGLHSGAVDEADFFLPQAAEDLRAEVLARHDAVIRELAGVSERSPSVVMHAGVTCLLRAVQELRDMVDPPGPVDPSEADPRHLLNADLLKIPEMRLNERWEPQQDPIAVQDGVLRFLAEPQPDWQTAFQTRCEAGDRIAVDRLLELDVWESDEQCDRLRDVRDQYLQPTRASLLSELVQFERRLQQVADVERRADDQQELEKRLQRLRTSLGSEPSASVEWCRQELAALRGGLRALQTGESESVPPASAPDDDPAHDHLLH